MLSEIPIFSSPLVDDKLTAMGITLIGQISVVNLADFHLDGDVLTLDRIISMHSKRHHGYILLEK